MNAFLEQVYVLLIFGHHKQDVIEVFEMVRKLVLKYM